MEQTSGGGRMNGAQVAMLFIIGADLGYALANHGKPREEPHDIWAALLANGIIVAILTAGGFWG